MKRLLLTVVVTALALTLVPLAVAGGPGGGGKKHGHKKFNLVGTATAVSVAQTPVDPAVDPATDPAVEPTEEPAVEPVALSTITIQVKAGSHIKGIKGTEKLFDVDADVKVRQLTEDGAVPATLADIEAGDRVKVKGKIAYVGGSRVYTITCIKYRDLTPDEVVPEPAE